MERILRRVLLAGVLWVLILSGCNGDKVGNEISAAPASLDKSRNLAPVTSPATQGPVVDGINALGFHLMRDTGGNGVVAPFSASLSIARLEAGSNGDTKAALRALLQTDAAAMDLYAVLNELDLGINSRIGTASLGAQPSRGEAQAWAQARYGYLLSYFDTLVENFGLKPLRVDFDLAPDDQSQTVAGWATQASGLPTQVTTTKDTRFVLGDAIRLNASWAEPFDPALTETGTFQFIEFLTRTRVPFMNKSAILPQTSGDGFVALALPLQGSQQFLIVLPDAGRFHEVRTALTSVRLRQIAAALTPAQVNLALPKFTLDSTIPLELGVASVKGTADFSALDGTKELYVSSAAHHSQLSVTEAGLQAGSATLLALDDLRPETWTSNGFVGYASFSSNTEPYFWDTTIIVGRPFIFAVRDTITGAILFLGQLMNPTP
ncbi:MAG: hypothetical protein A2075_23435 [Geobacteraceae bacterium GWC2_58_44]|nr:MAG: hypothetical protein A2075_23435 [Geobacteraceae bacterium GWC2_58_44]